MFIRILAIFALIALLVTPISVLAQEETPSPAPEGTGEAIEERPPTEYFAYGAVGLLLFLLLFVGVGYVRTAMKTSGAE